MKELLNKEIDKICKMNRLTGANVVLFIDEQIVYSHNYGYANKARKKKDVVHCKLKKACSLLG